MSEPALGQAVGDVRVAVSGLSPGGQAVAGFGAEI